MNSNQSTQPTPANPPARLDLAGDVVDLAAEICDLESVSGNETGLADAVEQALRAWPHLQVQRWANVVIAQTDNPRQQLPVIIAGHLDTVPVAGNLPTWRTDPTPQHPKGSWLHGRGTVDMKAGVAVALHVAATVTNPRYPVTFLWYDNEEVQASKNGLGLLAAHRPELLRGRLALLGEPTDAMVEAGCQGTLRVIISLYGQAAHTARAWKGVNAIHLASGLLGHLAAYQPREVPLGPVTYREGLNAVGVAGGTGLAGAANVLPDRLELTLNYRFAPDLCLEQALAHVVEQATQGLGTPPVAVQAEVENPSSAAGFGATSFGAVPVGGWTLRVTDASPAANPGLDQPAVQEFLATVSKSSAQPAVRAKYGWTDVARFSALGTPALNYGPGDPSLAHRDDERVSVTQIEQCAQLLKQWLS